MSRLSLGLNLISEQESASSRTRRRRSFRESKLNAHSRLIPTILGLQSVTPKRHCARTQSLNADDEMDLSMSFRALVTLSMRRSVRSTRLTQLKRFFGTNT